MAQQAGRVLSLSFGLTVRFDAINKNPDLFLVFDDQRHVRLLGVRREMTPPEGGY